MGKTGHKSLPYCRWVDLDENLHGVHDAFWLRPIAVKVLTNTSLGFGKPIEMVVRGFHGLSSDVNYSRIYSVNSDGRWECTRGVSPPIALQTINPTDASFLEPYVTYVVDHDLDACLKAEKVADPLRKGVLIALRVLHDALTLHSQVLSYS